MKPPPFDYFCPETLDEALALLAEHGEAAKVIAGGQSLVPMLNLRALHPARADRHQPACPASITHQPGGRSAQGRRSGASQGGARVGGGRKTRRRLMALGVSLSSPTGRSATGARCAATSATTTPRRRCRQWRWRATRKWCCRAPGSTRTVAADDFFTRHAVETAAEANELLVEVRVPQAPAGQGAGFHEVSARKGDFAYVAVGATLERRGRRL